MIGRELKLGRGNSLLKHHEVYRLPARVVISERQSRWAAQMIPVIPVRRTGFMTTIFRKARA